MSAPGRLDGKRILITGGARGIGAAFCRALARHGARVAVADLRYAAAKELADELPGAIALEVDVANAASVRAMFAALDNEWGGLDVLVNNAGVLRQQDFLETDEETWNIHSNVNGLGTLLCTQEAAKRFIAQGGGKIINTCSTSSKQPSERYAAYAASKAAVLSLTQGTARELAPHGITVNAIGPGIIDTELWDADRQSGRATSLDEYAASIPLGRTGTPDDVAPVAVFLASDDSNYMTGQLLMVDGGMVM